MLFVSTPTHPPLMNGLPSTEARRGLRQKNFAICAQCLDALNAQNATFSFAKLIELT